MSLSTNWFGKIWDYPEDTRFHPLLQIINLRKINGGDFAPWIVRRLVLDIYSNTRTNIHTRTHATEWNTPLHSF
jgi:hypothetical protein